MITNIWVSYRQGAFEKSDTGAFRAVDNRRRRGPIRVNPAVSLAFHLGGNRRALLLQRHDRLSGSWAGRRTESSNTAIDRLHRLKVNRLRVTIAGRENMFFGEPVMNGENFTIFLDALARRERRRRFTHPGFDYTRFNLAYWQQVRPHARASRGTGT